MSWIETARGSLEIRELKTVAEMILAEEIQQNVWGAETLPCPKEVLIPVQHEGGLLAGAFFGQTLVGLVFSFPTRDPGIQHSHLLATQEDWRGLGIGTALKWFQRQWCLERGVRQLRWTVDPLRAANADINVRQLGGLSNTYLVDYYGEMQGIDAGAPTDRLLLEWQLDSPRVVDRSLGRTPNEYFADVPFANDRTAVTMDCIRKGLTSPAVLIGLPENFIEISRFQPELAVQWRLTTRELFMDYFGRGYRIVEFTRRGGPAYLLEAMNTL